MLWFFAPIVLAAATSAQGEGPGNAPVPPSEPQVLGAGTVSQEGRYEFCSTMSRDRRTITIGIEHGEWQSMEAWHWEDGEWTGPQHVLGTPEYTAQDPYLSEDEARLYFITRARGDADIGYLTRNEAGDWADPVLLDAPINGPGNDYFVSITRSGEVYWSSDRANDEGGYDIYSASLEGASDSEATRLPSPVNTRAYEGDPYIDPEGRYLIFASSRRRGLGRGDLYLSLPDGEGGWSYPIAFDERVNTPGHELCPLVTLDGSALLFTSNEDIRWVSTAIIEEMIAGHSQAAQ
ncbi:hypothetical protein CD351_01375 [Erythrobacter sp. KY5]|uniref:TolB family protein n=1 Tax=Erythrobacter sp. KY5 TaxID=2011159 RepID=UPI000DBF0995|nr:PD40 domain-containing protein [Erythrobacter sp. KY5]AWW73072.1 hypothetical protein CD351_01375 [Erythrobacter sp. KY5]